MHILGYYEDRIGAYPNINSRDGPSGQGSRWVQLLIISLWAFRSPYFTSNTGTFNYIKEQYPYLNPILSEQQTRTYKYIKLIKHIQVHYNIYTNIQEHQKQSLSIKWALIANN
jgi:hypothetical protein